MRVGGRDLQIEPGQRHFGEGDLAVVQEADDADERGDERQPGDRGPPAHGQRRQNRGGEEEPAGVGQEGIVGDQRQGREQRAETQRGNKGLEDDPATHDNSVTEATLVQLRRRRKGRALRGAGLVRSIKSRRPP